MLLVEMHNLTDYIHIFGYLGILLFFLTIDQITPIPEEISLLTIGYLSSKGVFNPVIAGLISLAAFITVDTIYFFLVRSGRKWTERFRKRRKGSFLKRIETGISSNFAKTLLVLCFIPRMRMWAPIISSMVKTPYSKFIKYDSTILALFTSIYIALGILFHKGLDLFITKFEAFQNVVFFGVMLIASILLFIAYRKSRNDRPS